MLQFIHEYLLKIKESQSKMNKLRSNKLEIQGYLKSKQNITNSQINFRTGKNDIPLQTDQRVIRYSSYNLLGCASDNVLGISMFLLSACKGI